MSMTNYYFLVRHICIVRNMKKIKKEKDDNILIKEHYYNIQLMARLGNISLI
jgi:hypothetical protein